MFIWWECNRDIAEKAVPESCVQRTIQFHCSFQGSCFCSMLEWKQTFPILPYSIWIESFHVFSTSVDPPVLSFSLHTDLQSNTEACSPFSLCVLGGGSGLCFNMMLWISPPHCASPSVSLWFHSTQLNPSHSHRKALVLSGGVWLALIVNPWRWPGSVSVMVGHLLLKPGPNVSL